MDIIIAPPITVTSATQFGAPAPTLSPGEVVEAQVLQILADGRARLAVVNSVIDVVSTVPLTPGTTVRLAVKSTPDGIRFTLLDPVAGRTPLIPTTELMRAAPATTLSGAAAPAGSNAGAGVGTSTSTTGTASASPSAASAPATTISISKPLLDAPAAPAAQASQASSISSTSSAPSTSPPTPPSGPSPPSPEAASAAALAGAVRGAAARQCGLAPLFADLAVAVGSPALPEAVRAAAEQVLSLRVPAEGGVAAATIAQAFRRSGLFLESDLASGAPTAPAEDLKAALTVLRHVLKAWLDAGPSGKGVNLPPEIPNAPPLAPGLASASPEHALPSGPNPSTPPPYRGAPTAAQPQAAPLVSPAMDAEEMGHVLMRDTDGAIARQTLLQAASLPDRVDHADTSGPHWLFEIPFATGQGTTMAQLEIARDGRAAPREGITPVWRARFSIDVEPIGPVHGQIALIGERAAVTLWAERSEGAAQLRDNAAMLADALRRAELEPDVLVRDGSPPRPSWAAARAGRFLDRAS